MAKFLPEYSARIPPAISVSASGESNGILDNSAGVTIIKERRRIIKPIKPQGPTVLPMGAAIIEDNEKTFETPSILNFQAILIIMIASGNS